jgi:hypothetical protein
VLKFHQSIGVKLKLSKEKRIEIFTKFETYFNENIADNYVIDKKATIVDLNKPIYVKKYYFITKV